MENPLARIKELYEWGHKPKEEYLTDYDAIQRELKTLGKLAHFLDNVVAAG